ncbi:MAG: nucleotide exchange factor GrpE [Geminicoccaceae bacterium]|nr:nucleotide exchange factor GrpE [Geminicoccaceae bacterium]
MSSEPVDVKVVDRRWWAQQGQTPDTAGTAAEEGWQPEKPTYVQELEQRLAEQERLAQEYLAKYRGAAREFEEARARLRKELAREVERARRSFLADLLEVVDNLDRAIDAARASSSTEAVLAGVEMVRRQFLGKLEGIGVRRLDAEGAEHLHHVGALGLQGDPGALHRVAAVEQEGAALPLRADRPDEGGDPVEPADPPVAPGELDEVLVGEGVGRGRAGGDAETVEERLAGEMRGQATDLAHADVGRGLAEPDRHELGMQVGEVEDRDVADRAEGQKVGLAEPVLRRQPTGAAGAEDRAGGGREGQKIAAADQGGPPGVSNATGRTRGCGPRRKAGGSQPPQAVTSILLSAL